MEKLFSFQNNVLRSTDSVFTRYLYNQVAFESRLVGIRGIRGVGKTTLLVQYLKTQPLPTSLYVTADHPWFYQNTLLDTAEEWHKRGGRLLVVDEVHKSPRWSAELKNMYDGFPDMRVLFTASSALDIYRGEADLSRRALSYTLHGMSFREYLAFYGIARLPVLSLPDLFANHQQIASDINLTLPNPLVPFKKYLQTGYLPLGIETRDTDEYGARVSQLIDAVLGFDLAFLHDYSATHQTKIRRLLGILSDSVPYTPNTQDLATTLQVSRNTVLGWLQHLEQAALTRNIHKSGHGLSALQKPDKIVLENTNFSYALGQTPNDGTLRETFVANQISNAGYALLLAEQGDFVVENSYTLEVGGKNKKQKQIKAIANSWLVQDNIEVGYGNVIPLWLFGFLY
ncbi:MAG: ATP-binding protein [Cytophagales bacterium]|nr:MAG: ATP-binding protein [Cytophagales bacterium]